VFVGERGEGFGGKEGRKMRLLKGYERDRYWRLGRVGGGRFGEVG
jgi:hypothetical protein